MHLLIVLLLGVVNWIATKILIEGHIFEPVRQQVARVPGFSKFPTCALCVGTWVGIAEAAVFGGPLAGMTGFVANALVFKGLGEVIRIAEEVALGLRLAALSAAKNRNVR